MDRRQHQQPEHPRPGIPRHRNGRRPIERVDPILINLMDRLDTIPPGEPDDITENALVNGIHLAIELAEPEEQISIVPRIMSAEDLARERLERPEVLDIEQDALLSAGEIGLLLRNTPSPRLDELSSRGRFHGDCVACYGDATVRLGCDCTYCLPCLRRLLRIGLAQTGVFPPRCCNESLGERTVRRVRRPGLVHLYRQRGFEANVPAGQRLYCHDGACNTFIPPHCRGVCQICRQETCLECRGPQHPQGFRCQGGQVVEDVWETMDRNGLVNCPKCGNMVQLGDGCNHMT